MTAFRFLREVTFFSRKLRPHFHAVVHAFSYIVEPIEVSMPTSSRSSAEWLEGFCEPTSDSFRLSQLALPGHFSRQPGCSSSA